MKLFCYLGLACLFGQFFQESSAQAREDIFVSNPYVRPMGGAARIFMSIENPGKNLVTLKKIQGVFEKKELKASIHFYGISLTGPLELPPGGQVELTSSSKGFVEVTGFSRPLKKGDFVQLVMTFSTGQELAVLAPVAPVGDKL